jgi:Arc/MetJ family transcription regulator
MKTTIDIAEPLLQRAKRVAREEGTTLRALVEQGLREVLKSRRQRAFTLRRASFKGEGLQAPFRDAPWADVRDTIYEGRGS